jgi:hypothetical protein
MPWHGPHRGPVAQAPYLFAAPVNTGVASGVDLDGRNHDKIRLWADYISRPRRSSYLYDDKGRRGGLRPGSRFVIAGDLNADPYDGDS